MLHGDVTVRVSGGPGRRGCAPDLFLVLARLACAYARARSAVVRAADSALESGKIGEKWGKGAKLLSP